MDDFTRRDALKFLAKGAVGVSVIQLISCTKELDIFNPENDPEVITEQLAEKAKVFADDFMKADLGGARLGSDSETLRKTVFVSEFEPGWDMVHVVKEYKIINVVRKENHIEITVGFSYLATVHGGELIEKNEKSDKYITEVFRIYKKDNGFEIISCAPIVTKDILLIHLKELLKMAKTPRGYNYKLQNKAHINRLKRELEAALRQNKNANDIREKIDKYSRKSFFEYSQEERINNLTTVINTLQTI